MTEEERIFQGLLFRPGAQELRDIKLRTHNLCLRYNQTFEDDVETRAALLRQIVGAMGEDGFIQGRCSSTTARIRPSANVSLATST